MVVKTSDIPGAGLGLVANCEFKKRSSHWDILWQAVFTATWPKSPCYGKAVQYKDAGFVVPESEGDINLGVHFIYDIYHMKRALSIDNPSTKTNAVLDANLVVRANKAIHIGDEIYLKYTPTESD